MTTCVCGHVLFSFVLVCLFSVGYNVKQGSESTHGTGDVSKLGDNSMTYSGNTTNTILKIAFLSHVKQGHGAFFGGAFYRALRDINADPKLLPGYLIESMFADTRANVLGTIQSMTDEYINETKAFIGPDGMCSSHTLIATAWNLPMVSYVSIPYIVLGITYLLNYLCL